MGGATSSLPKEQTTDLARKLREEYDRLEAAGTSDAETMKAINAAYQKFIDEHLIDKEQGWENNRISDATGRLQKQSSRLEKKQQEELIIRLQTKSNVRRLSSSASAPTVGVAATKSSRSPPPSGRVNTRRKSFAQRNMDTIKESDRTPPSEEKVPQGVDSWDSVTQQPYCFVCLMAFKTTAALDRHEKFSQLHEKVVRKLKDDYEQSILTKDVVAIELQQVEGVHYKLLYAGRKLFWRTQESVDLSFYYHFASNCVEVIAFDVSLEAKEINRIYLDYAKAVKITEELFSRKEFDEKELAIIAAQTPLEKEESLRLSLTTFILSRICISDEGSPLYGENNKISLRLIPSDPKDFDPLLSEHPPNLYPVRVNKKRRSSTEEIGDKIQGINLETSAIGVETAKAEHRQQETASALQAIQQMEIGQSVDRTS